MKIDLQSFNEHLHIKDFLDWIMEVERFFDYMSIPRSKGEVSSLQVQRWSLSLVGTITDLKCLAGEEAHDFMVEDEAATQNTILTIGF